MADADPEQWRDMLSVVDAALGQQPAGVRRRVFALINLIDALALLRFGRRLRALDPPRRLRLLGALQDSRLSILRCGVWGLRTLLFMGYYARPETYQAIGYRAHPDGWEARGRPGHYGTRADSGGRGTNGGGSRTDGGGNRTSHSGPSRARGRSARRPADGPGDAE